MRHLLSRLLRVQSIIFVYIVFYAIATYANPNGSSARYISLIWKTYDIPLNLIAISGISAGLGLLFSRNALQNWFFSLPFILYSGLAIYGIILSPSPDKSITGIVNFIFVISLFAALTWEKINE